MWSNYLIRPNSSEDSPILPVRKFWGRDRDVNFRTWMWPNVCRSEKVNFRSYFFPSSNSACSDLNDSFLVIREHNLTVFWYILNWVTSKQKNWAQESESLLADDDWRSNTLCIISMFLGLLLPIRKCDKVRAKLSFSPKNCGSVLKSSKTSNSYFLWSNECIFEV